MDTRKHSRPATSVALVFGTLAAAASLVACGQKGPLYLPGPSSASARAHVPSAPDDAMPSTQPPLPPTPGPSTPGMPSGVASGSR